MSKEYHAIPTPEELILTGTFQEIDTMDFAQCLCAIEALSSTLTAIRLSRRDAEEYGNREMQEFNLCIYEGLICQIGIRMANILRKPGQEEIFYPENLIWSNPAINTID